MGTREGHTECVAVSEWTWHVVVCECVGMGMGRSVGCAVPTFHVQLHFFFHLSSPSDSRSAALDEAWKQGTADGQCKLQPSRGKGYESCNVFDRSEMR